MLQYASRPASSPPSAAIAPAPSAERVFALIETPRARLQLVRTGLRSDWPSRYLYKPCTREDQPAAEGWLWEAIGPKGESLGFIGLLPAATTGQLQPVFGPSLVVMLKRAVALEVAAGIVTGLMGWLDRNHICHVVHASHAESDPQLGAWLDAAGFVYTGCHEGDGSRSMILIL